MLNNYVAIWIALVALGCPSLQAAQTSEQKPQSRELIQPEVDNTDIYAIPLDNDEEEEKEEEKYLESLQWKDQGTEKK